VAVFWQIGDYFGLVLSLMYCWKAALGLWHDLIFAKQWVNIAQYKVMCSFINTDNSLFEKQKLFNHTA